MTPRFDRFILLAEMRTGSNFLESNLNALAGLICHGEAFNPAFIAKKDCDNYLGVSLTQRDADPDRLLAAMRAQGGLWGFRFFHDHDPRVLDQALADPACAKIVLTRNPLESYISLKIARATGQWRLGDARRRRAAKAHFDPAEFAAHLQDLQDFQRDILHRLQTSGQSAFYIGYEDINDLAVLNGLAAFLGVEDRLSALEDRVKKQNPESLEDLVDNPDQMLAALGPLDHFDLGRTPNFEPRRSAAVPSYVAARGADLLYLPIRGGPEAQVRDWLARLGEDQGLIEGFNQRLLRTWFQNRPQARSFTVLRHPLARAHAAFCDRILTGAAGELRQYLKRAWKLPLPAPDRLDRLTPEDQAQAFSLFLTFLRGNLAGQTPVRIDAAWAGQLTCLQAISTQVVPDMVLREDRLAEGLAYLSLELGVDPPELAPAPPQAGFPLDAIWRPEHEDLAREAYARDYAAFGFGALR